MYENESTYAAVHKEPDAALHERLLPEAKVPQRLQQLVQEVGRRRLRGAQARAARRRRMHPQRRSAEPPTSAAKLIAGVG